MENLNKLTRLLGADRIMTAEDVQQILLGIMEILKSYKEGTESINEDTKKVVNSLLEQTVKYNQETISDFKSEAEKAHGERMKELQDFLSEVKVTLGDMEVMMSEVKDGKDADEEKVIEEVISRIKIDPTVVTVTAEEIRDRLASLKDEDRLDKSAIKGLDKVIQQKDLDYAIATLQQQASFLINKGGLKTVSHDVSLSGDGTPESPLAVVSSSGLTLQTDGVANGSQTLLNLVGGTNVTLTDNGTGSVTIAATGGSGSGDVVGPASATDNAVVRYDGTTGKLVQNSAVTIADTTGDITAGKYNTVAISGSSTPTLTVTGTTAVSGTNTGDQTSIVGITGTKAQFDTAVSDGGIVFVGDVISTTNFASTTSAQLAGVISDETGSGALVFGTSPDLTTPDINDATADSLTAGTTSAGVLLKNNAGTTVASFGVGSSSSTNIALSGTVALGTNNITMTGSLAATGARVTKGWFTDVESTNMPTVGGTAILTSLTAPQFTTIELGNASDTTLSRSSAGVLAVEGVVVDTISAANTLSNKTLTTPVINGATLNGDLQIDATPNTDDTWNGKSTNTFNAAATIAQFDCVYLTSSSTWALTDADAIGTAGNVLIMMAGEAGTASNPLRVIEPGSWVRNDAWNWTVGGALYLDTATSGGLTQTAPSGADDVVKVVGYAASADVIYFAPSVNWIIHT